MGGHEEDAADDTSTTVQNSTNAHILNPVTLCILVTETAERFAYFGFRAVLVLYFRDELAFTENQAIALFAYTTCLAYSSPIFGSVVADGYLGRYSTIFWFGLVYVVGLAILTLASAATDFSLQLRRSLTFTGLFLACTGTGGIKPCVSAFGADQVALRFKSTCTSTDANLSENETENSATEHERVESSPNGSGDYHRKDEIVREFFAIFYFCINVGAVSSIAVIPIIRGRYGYGAAFLLPTIFMVSAILLFISKRNDYIHHKPGEDGASLPTIFKLCWWLIRKKLWALSWVASTFPPSWGPGEIPGIVRQSNGQHNFVPLEHENDVTQNDSSNDIISQQLNDAAQVIHVLPILAMFPIFWALYDQQGSVWTLQATRMELYGLQPEQMTLINPIEIMIFVPLFDRVIYPAMECRGINVAPLRRMSWGMLLAAVSFIFSGFVESSIQYKEENNLGKVNVFWQLPQLTILAVAEIFVSVTGLEFAYSTSPERLKALLMGIYLLTTSIGDLFSGILYSTLFSDMNRSTIMYVCAALMLGNLALFVLVSRWWKQQNHRKSGTIETGIQSDGLELQERHQLV